MRGEGQPWAVCPGCISRERPKKPELSQNLHVAEKDAQEPHTVCEVTSVEGPLTP